MNQKEKFAKAREVGVSFINLPAGSAQIGTGEFAVPTEFGVVKIKVTAVKSETFNIEDEAEAFRFEVEQAEEKAREAQAKREAKKSK